VTVENDVRLQVLTGIKKRSIERCHERFARRPCKTRRYASQRINCSYIICSAAYFHAEMIADHVHIGPLVTARICGCERDAVKRLLRHGKCGADERRIDTARRGNCNLSHTHGPCTYYRCCKFAKLLR